MKYLRYAELTEELQGWAAAYPHLAELRSIGQSYEGREIWLMEITDRSLGTPNEKPGFYVDGNFHAGEVTGAACAMYTIQYLLEKYGSDPQVTKLLAEQTFYIVPRVSPDGAELYLTTPYRLRSSVRPYPETEPQPGLQLEDVNGDGLILHMRVPDPDGEWAISKHDPRLLVARRPDDFEGPFYRLLDEGLIHEYDGVEIKQAPSRWGLDLNRQFPVQWDAAQPGAGPYPLSEPETKAVADFLLSQKNIVGIQSFHTTSGYILRPSATEPDAKLEPKDLAAMKAIGKLGEELTSYPCVGVLEGFTNDSTKPLKGVFMEWTYRNLGIITYSTELWDLKVRAGRDRFPFKPLDEEDGLAILRFVDRELAGQGFYPWTPFEHPQLGPVEIGGFDWKYLMQNPPEQLLAAECHKNLLFTLKHAAAAPRLQAEAQVTQVAEGVYKIEAILANQGYLPTSGTELGRKLVDPLVASLALTEGVELVHGKARTELEHLDGWVGTQYTYFGPAPLPQRKRRLEWVVTGPAGASLELTVVGGRAGTCRVPVVLQEGATDGV